MASTHGGPRREVAGTEMGVAVLNLVRDGATFSEAAAQLGISRSLAHRRFHDALTRVGAPDVERYRGEQLARLDMMRAIIYGILATRHPLVVDGVVIDGAEDDMVTLGALDRLAKVEELAAKLTGTFARSEVSVSGNLSYVIVGGPAGWLGPVPDDVRELTAGPVETTED